MLLLRASISALLITYGCCLLMNLGDAPLYTAGLFQGDIVGFDPNTDRAATIYTDLLWPGGVVPYVIHESAASIKEYILAGMEEYHQKTCIRFVEASPETQDYILIGWWQGCNSQVGRVGGLQHLSLGTGCHLKGLVVHELGHAIGFYHEQNRADRDDYLEIIWDNIIENYRTQFIKMEYYKHNLLNESFDYKSIMLYEEYAFSKDREMHTVRVKQEGVVIGPVWNKPGLSESDVRKVNKLYQCFGQVRPDPPDVPDYYCDFSQDECEFVNQKNMGSDFERMSVTLGGRTGFVMLADGTRGKSHYAKLVSPYFKLYGRLHGCLSFDYFLGSPNTYSFDVTKQSSINSTEALRVSDVTGQWRKAYLPVLKSDGKSRFFFLAVYEEIGGDAKIAIDNIKFVLEECPSN